VRLSLVFIKGNLTRLVPVAHHKNELLQHHTISLQVATSGFSRYF